MTKKEIGGIVILAIVAIIVVIAEVVAGPNTNTAQLPTSGQPTAEQPIATAMFYCDGGKTINAAFYKGTSTPPSAPGMPPTPGGSVALALSDGRTMTLPQTISADGGRYANADESIVFWNVGDTAFITENNAQTYSNCSTANPANASSSPASAGYLNGTYVLDGKSVTLVSGRAESEAAPGSASMIVTQYFGNEASGDLNGDGVPDVAFLLTQSGGGSGTFFYVVAALKTPTGYQGTNAVLLGDRIAPQTTQIENGKIIVNYADRNPGEPMSTRPSIGVSKYLRVENGILTEVSG